MKVTHTCKIAFLISFCLSVTQLLQAQDWLAWSFQYDFKIESNKRGEYLFESMELSINEPFRSDWLIGSVLNYDDNTSVYSLILSYGCVSCGFSGMHFPPGVFLRLYLFDSFGKQHFSIVVPIVFDTISDPDRFQKMDTNAQRINNGAIYFDLKTIVFEDFMFFNPNYIRYEGIRINSDGEVHLYTPGEFDFPRPEKLRVVGLNDAH
ncbi:MAG: hypothetical protein GC193_01975 [Cryomorphaceae bacterium]|nr:hypothetical protein [Cryomorphaceae bacterium]